MNDPHISHSDDERAGDDLPDDQSAPGNRARSRYSERNEVPTTWSNWLRWMRRAFPSGSGFEGQRYLLKWVFISSAIGIVAGLGAIAFTWGIEFVTEHALGDLVGYLPPTPVGEGGAGIMQIGRPWLLPLITMAGGLISGIIVFTWAPEAEGHGTDAAIDAIHFKRGRVRGRIPPIKLIASAITIGTGGSGGREGPAAQISAGFGSILGKWLQLSAQDRRIAVAVGIGAGIGAIFRAPLGGAVMAAEILYIHDLEVEALIPTLMASIVGYSIYAATFGYVPIFGNLSEFGFTHPFQLIYYAILGLACGLVGLLYDKTFYTITDFFHRIRIPNWVKPGIGGLLVGLIGLVIPGALHTGYGWVQVSMGPGLMALPVWIVLLLPFAKIVSTSLSIGSGGSGGIFGPGMVIGGMLGAVLWRVSNGTLPQVPVEPAPFVIIGMMALFGGIAHAPLAVMLMVAEMTGNLSLLAPAMVAVAISTALVGDHTIYRSQLRTRADSPVHRVRFSFPLLSSLLVRDAMAPVGTVVTLDMPVSDVEKLAENDEPIALDSQGNVAGLVRLDWIDDIDVGSRTVLPAADVIDGNPILLQSDQSLDVALDRLAARGLSWAPVLEEGHLVGRLRVSDVMHTYKSTLERSVRRSTSLTPQSMLFEARLGQSSTLAGRTLREAGLPRDTLVVSITREGETLFPHANTELLPGDVVMIMADRASEPEVRSFLEGATHGSDGNVS